MSDGYCQHRRLSGVQCNLPPDHETHDAERARRAGWRYHEFVEHFTSNTQVKEALMHYSDTFDSERTEPWVLKLTCCGHADGFEYCQTYNEADRFRYDYLDAKGHDRSVVLSRKRDGQLFSSHDMPFEVGVTARELAARGLATEDDHEDEDDHDQWDHEWEIARELGHES